MKDKISEQIRVLICPYTKQGCDFYLVESFPRCEICKKSKNDKMMIEQEFHNKREAFFIEFNGVITFINKGMSHEEYFKMIHHSEYIDEIIRGYLLEDHIILYVGKNFNIPMNITMQGIFDLLKNNRIRGYNLKWIGLGCIKGKVGEEWEPQVKIFIKRN